MMLNLKVAEIQICQVLCLVDAYIWNYCFYRGLSMVDMCFVWICVRIYYLSK